MIQEITNQFDQRLPVARPFYLPQDRLPQMELRVFGALCDVRAPEVIPSLEQFAESSDVYIRVRALQGLRKIGSLTSAPVFLRALNEPREEIGFIAMMSLIELAGGGSFDWVPRYDEILGAPDFYAAQFRQWWEAEGEARAQAIARTRMHP